MDLDYADLIYPAIKKNANCANSSDVQTRAHNLDVAPAPLSATRGVFYSWKTPHPMRGLSLREFPEQNGRFSDFRLSENRFSRVRLSRDPSTARPFVRFVNLIQFDYIFCTSSWSLMYVDFFSCRLELLFVLRIIKTRTPLYYTWYCEGSVIVRFPARRLQSILNLWKCRSTRMKFVTSEYSFIFFINVVLLNDVLVSVAHSNDMKQHYVITLYVKLYAFCFHLFCCWNIFLFNFVWIFNSFFFVLVFENKDFYQCLTFNKDFVVINIL